MISAEIFKQLRHAELKVTLQAEQGSISIVHGPSGAGKTTLLKIIAGLAKAEQAKILVNSETWVDTAAGIHLPPQHRLAGFVFQNYALFPHMSVRQHLTYASTDSLWIDRLLQIGQLDRDARHKPEDLSGGQQQRLAILRAMANKPALLLMDEPFSALDQPTKAGLITDLKQIWNELQTTVIIVSHYPQELESIADQTLYIGS